jgi:hypothetical protein
VEDPLAFLAACGFPATRRPDGLYDVQNVRAGMTSEEVLQLWLQMKIWPLPLSPEPDQPAGMGWFCGG